MKILVVLVMLCLGIKTSAQKNKQPVSYNRVVSFSPLALAGPDNTLMLSGEFRPNENWGFLLDAGYVFASQYYNNNKASGFNLRPSARWYFGKRLNEFVQMQAFWKQVNYQIYDWLNKDVVDGVPSYTQLQDFTQRKNVFGINIMAGEVTPLSKNLLFDFYAGLGVRWRRQDVVGEPGSQLGTDQEEIFYNVYARRITTVSLPVSLRIVYVIH